MARSAQAELRALRAEMARGKGKACAKQSSLRAAGLLPTLKKPAEAVGMAIHVPGSFWARCPAADKAKIFKCNVREFSALHKFPGGQPPQAAFEVQEMGEKGDGSLQSGLATDVSSSRPIIRAEVISD